MSNQNWIPNTGLKRHTHSDYQNHQNFRRKESKLPRAQLQSLKKIFTQKLAGIQPESMSKVSKFAFGKEIDMKDQKEDFDKEAKIEQSDYSFTSKKIGNGSSKKIAVNPGNPHHRLTLANNKVIKSAKFNAIRKENC